jgi:hypothetical protein
MTLKQPIIRDRKWKPLSWGAGTYEVSDFGDVRTLAHMTLDKRGRQHPIPERVLKHSVQRDGYHLVALYENGARKQFLVHRLVYEHHIGPLIDGLDIAHRDGDKDNNCAANLVQCTRKENIAHQLDHGTRCRGENKPASKLVSAHVRLIRKLHNEGKSYRALAAQFNVSHHTIGALCRREIWKWLA